MGSMCYEEECYIEDEMKGKHSPAIFLITESWNKEMYCGNVKLFLAYYEMKDY